MINRLKSLFKNTKVDPKKNNKELFGGKTLSRRRFLQALAIGSVGAASTQVPDLISDQVFASEDKELTLIKFKEYFQKHYRFMSAQEKQETIERFERKSQIIHDKNVNIKTTEALPNTLFGYALNLGKCKGYGDCATACRTENNLPEDGSMDYIRIHELEKGSFSMHDGSLNIVGQVPKEESFYLPMQCMHCENPPCVPVCPVGATWKEDDGIVVVDYNWCIGCRYCESACPYEARRFNWKEPSVPSEHINADQHYLGNRDRYKGVMEKCHFCTHRTREGRQPACQEACPTGARVFGNLLDPDSEIRWILKHKKVFRLKEDLNTQPQFYYYMD